MRSRVRAFVVATGSLLAFVASSRAHAQSSAAVSAPASGVSDAARDEARRHFEAGIRAAEATQWQEAIRELQLARDIRATAAVHYNLGVAYRAVGRNRDAIAALREFLRAPGGLGDADHLRTATTYAAELERAMGRLELSTQPSDATVSIDGATAVAATSVVSLDPGRHVIVVEAPEHRSATRSITIAAGASARLDVQLVPNTTAGRIVISTNVSDSTIRLDDRPISNGQADEFVAAGRHVIEVRAPGRSTFRREVSVITNGVIRVHAELTDQRPIVASPWFWVTATLIAGGLTVGGVLLFSTTDPLYQGSLGHVTGAVHVRP